MADRFKTAEAEILPATQALLPGQGNGGITGDCRTQWSVTNIEFTAAVNGTLSGGTAAASTRTTVPGLHSAAIPAGPHGSTPGRAVLDKKVKLKIEKEQNKKARKDRRTEEEKIVPEHRMQQHRRRAEEIAKRQGRCDEEYIAACLPGSEWIDSD